MNAEDYDESKAMNEYLTRSRRQLMTDAEREESDLAQSHAFSEIGDLKHADPKTYSKTQQEKVRRVGLTLSSLDARIR